MLSKITFHRIDKIKYIILPNIIGKNRYECNCKKIHFNLFLSDLLLVDAVLLVDAQDLGLLHVGEDTVDQAPVLHVKLMFALLCSYAVFFFSFCWNLFNIQNTIQIHSIHLLLTWQFDHEIATV